MDPEAINIITLKAVELFGKASNNAVRITELTSSVLDDQGRQKLLRDLKRLLADIDPVTWIEDTDQFALVLRTIRETDNMALMHILSAMNNFKESDEDINKTLTRWVEITKLRSKAAII